MLYKQSATMKDNQPEAGPQSPDQIQIRVKGNSAIK